MATDFYAQHVFKTLNSQLDKVRAIYDMGYGWEVWAQVELSLEQRATLTDPNSAHGALWEFKRESKVYDGTGDKCDFLMSYKRQGETGLDYHFVELKCLRKDKLSDFISAVRADIKKVKNAKPLPDWTQQAAYIGGWVMAVTVNPNNDSRVNPAMEQLAKEEGIQWTGRGTDSVIGAWTWTRTLLDQRTVDMV